MATLTIKTNIDNVIAGITADMDAVFNKDYLLRPVAIETIPMITERIHEKGQASDGSQIGTYSPGYMAVRTGNFGNSSRVSRGKNKGTPKDAGLITRGPSKGQPRPRYNRSGDTTIVVSLTRQLENNWSVLETTQGYGIGFTNPWNAEKLGFVEVNKRKVISNLSEKEMNFAVERINELVANAFNK